VDRDDMDARRAHQTLSSHLTGARNNLADLPQDDADAKRIAAQLDQLSARIDKAWADWEQTVASRQTVQHWESTQGRFTGWAAETDASLPQTRQAIIHCQYFL